MSIECDGGELRARVAPHFALGVRLEAAVDARPAVKVSPLTGKVEIACRKMRSGLQVTQYQVVVPSFFSLVSTGFTKRWAEPSDPSLSRPNLPNST